MAARRAPSEHWASLINALQIVHAQWQGGVHLDQAREQHTESATHAALLHKEALSQTAKLHKEELELKLELVALEMALDENATLAEDVRDRWQQRSEESTTFIVINTLLIGVAIIHDDRVFDLIAIVVA